MTDEEMRDCFTGYVRVEVKNHDYTFKGLIISIFRKYSFKLPEASPPQGPWRCVVQNEDGVCLIQSAKNLIVAK